MNAAGVDGPEGMPSSVGDGVKVGSSGVFVGSKVGVQVGVGVGGLGVIDGVGEGVFEG